MAHTQSRPCNHQLSRLGRTMDINQTSSPMAWQALGSFLFSPFMVFNIFRASISSGVYKILLITLIPFCICGLEQLHKYHNLLYACYMPFTEYQLVVFHVMNLSLSRCIWFVNKNGRSSTEVVYKVLRGIPGIHYYIIQNTRLSSFWSSDRKELFWKTHWKQTSF